MCGILGITARHGLLPSIDDATAVRLRDMMTRRGPDGAGLWRHQNILLAHRRLAVLDPSPAGAQPMLLAAPDPSQATLADFRATPSDASIPGGLGPRFAIVYNGELYNDAELRRELAARGARLTSTSDTETILFAWAAWGTEALGRLRGMFALAIVDLELRTLTLARDPLGIKPLYYWSDEREVVFASEARVVARHPRINAGPDLEMVSAYLTTIRTVLGERTMYAGVRALRPGQVMQCDLSGRALTQRLIDPIAPLGRLNDAELSEALRGESAADVVREVIGDSVRRHLRSDVPSCCLLSGGLDSTIVCAEALKQAGNLLTFCAGAPVPTCCADSGDVTDLAAARRVATELGTIHHEAHVSPHQFSERWSWMVREMGVPLSTPNEVAIHEVAAALRAAGCKVTLSGEGADELFGGYEAPNLQAIEHVRRVEEQGASPGLLELEAAAWTPVSSKGAILNEKVWGALDGDSSLARWYEREFSAAVAEDDQGAYDESAHLRFHRRVNLTGLLQRLDTATMLAGVEGRTPFADVVVLAISELVPMHMKFRAGSPSVPAASGAGTSAGAGGLDEAPEGEPSPSMTKIILRDAYRGRIPGEALVRPKASFPLPFQQWMEKSAGVLRTGAFSRTLFTDAAVETVASHPAKLWRLAWPMINLAMWGERF